MPDSLVARLADRLDIQPEHTDRVLRTLAQLIKKQSARDGRVRVPGLGVFQQTAEALTFEPDQALAAAVNRRYVGLEAVPLAGKAAPAVEEAPFEEETAAEDAFAVEEEAVAAAALAEEPAVEEEADVETALDEELAEEAVAETALDEEAAVAEELVEEESLDAAIAAEDAYAGPEAAAFEEEETLAGLPPYAPHEALSALTDEPPEAAEEALEAEADLAEPSTWSPPGTRWTGENLDELVEDEPAETADVAQEETPAPPAPARAQDLPPAPRPPRMAPPPRPQRRSPLPWILLVLFLGVVAAGAYFFLNPSDQPAAPGDAPVATGDAPPAAEADATGAAGGETGSSAAGQADTSAAAAQPAEPTSAEPAPEASLRIDRAKGGYTLVVASTTRQQAEAEAERFRQRLSGRSIPVDVLRGVSDGVTRYRVVVGQVATTNEAVALKNRLGAALPEGTWVTRIEPDS